MSNELKTPNDKINLGIQYYLEMIVPPPKGESEYYLPHPVTGRLRSGKVDFAIFENENKAEFYEIKPNSEERKTEGREQLKRYQKLAKAGYDITADFGTSILEEINGTVVKNIPFTYTSSIAEGFPVISEYMIDVKLVTSTDDPGIIGYEILKTRPVQSDELKEFYEAGLAAISVELAFFLAPAYVPDAAQSLSNQLGDIVNLGLGSGGTPGIEYQVPEVVCEQVSKEVQFVTK